MVGRANEAINASYATGNVTGERDYVGGLVGISNSSRIANSYAVGRVTGSSDVGGLAGYSYATSSVVHSYWDTQTSGVSRSSGGIGKTTRELQAPTGSTGIYSRWNADWWAIAEAAPAAIIASATAAKAAAAVSRFSIIVDYLHAY